jgi:hypothetical protein
MTGSPSAPTRSDRSRRRGAETKRPRPADEEAADAADGRRGRRTRRPNDKPGQGCGARRPPPGRTPVPAPEPEDRTHRGAAEPEPEPEPDEPDPEETRWPMPPIATPRKSSPPPPKAPSPNGRGPRTTGTPFPISCRRPPLEDRALTEPVAPIADRATAARPTLGRGPRRRNASAALDSPPPEFSARGTGCLHATRRDMSEPGAAPAIRPLDERPRDEAAPGGTEPAGRAPVAGPRRQQVASAAKAGKPILPPGRGAAKDRAPAQGSAFRPDRGALPRARQTAAADDNDAPKGLGGRLGGFLGRGRSRCRRRTCPGTGRRLAHCLRPRSPDGARGGAAGAQQRMPTRPGPRGTTPARPGRGRQPHRRPSGPQPRGEPDERSFRTGLILTIVLLILLAAIAVWSALFLPDSPVARLFGGGSDVAVDDPLDAPDAPLAITAPPAIGELASVDAPPAPRCRKPGPRCAPKPRRDRTRLDDAAPEDEAAADGIELADTVVPPPPDADPAPVETVAPDRNARSSRRCRPCRSTRVPSLEETEAVYAEYRIWQRPPDRPDLAPLDSLSDLSLSSVDPAVDGARRDFPALARGSTRPRRCARVPPPPPFGARPETTARGPRRGHRRRRGHARRRPRHRGPAAGSGHPRPREEAPAPAHPDLQHRGRDPRHLPPRAAPRRSGRGPGTDAPGAPGRSPAPASRRSRAPCNPPPSGGHGRLALPIRHRTRDKRNGDGRNRRQRERRRPLPRSGGASRQHGNPRRQRGATRAAGGASNGDRSRRLSRPAPRSPPTPTWPAPRPRATPCACGRST